MYLKKFHEDCYGFDMLRLVYLAMCDCSEFAMVEVFKKSSHADFNTFVDYDDLT